ncbi:MULTISPECIES: chemotaxis protein CheW [Pseudomonas]|uniref:Purine-binding chemotaxis protein CheW n=1 Tax=Pseudomonas juntendi TaxID=2666183 RepID=A0A7W2LYN8_9PSED|nr:MULTISPECIES: chemotaxis protein CheW [Pseudomonas]NOY03224.1 purine-binding chemotaxis protein CheW [Gammaproteobacteria bacterium]MBA6132479.1 purine-binding chemotaxis protein CheW [Pseudomonas juntendi]MBA6149316.1 purine-binding chemotaxis protein CheW [Pseudomonas juntendi]MCK2112201.1 chemotaxis protein CheW [Pseudomonas juntendi]MCK2114759.1 chemotaxis protein CheW [Pseudomonas juntendi]
MTDTQAPAAQPGNTKGALYLQFRIREQRFALSVHEVVEVLPLRPLKPIAQAPAWVAGILAHRGLLIPVIDLAALSFGQPAAQRTSTRLVLVHYRAGLQLGLVLEQATETLRCRPDEFQPYGVDTSEAPYLGPVRQDAFGMLQRIEVNDLLPDAVHALLYTQGPTGGPT